MFVLPTFAQSLRRTRAERTHEKASPIELELELELGSRSTAEFEFEFEFEFDS